MNLLNCGDDDGKSYTVRNSWAQDVRELRGLIAHHTRLIRQRTQAKNRLRSTLHRYNIVPPTGGLFAQARAASRPPRGKASPTGSRPLVGLLIADLRRLLPPPEGTPRAWMRKGTPSAYPTVSTPKPPVRTPPKRRLTPREVSWLYMLTPEQLTERQRSQLREVCQTGSDLHLAYELTQEFVTMIKELYWLLGPSVRKKLLQERESVSSIVADRGATRVQFENMDRCLHCCEEIYASSSRRSS
jgi:hypothetical protein